MTTADLSRLRTALTSARYSYCAGSTHNFYHYPARFAPEIARVVVEEFTSKDQWVLDPFMGGGTTIIEALLADRRACGVDLNSLAHFVTKVRTSPLSSADIDAIRAWAERVASVVEGPSVAAPPEQVRNLPLAVRRFMAAAKALVDVDADLRFERRAEFARCVLLRLGQLATDCRDFTPTKQWLVSKLSEVVEEMIAGLSDFETRLPVGRRELRERRALAHRSAVGLEASPELADAKGKVRLVFTSPPYPSVHVLYHRWQIYGRKQTPAPYWIAEQPDGFYEAHYTGGSPTPTGRDNYFRMITQAFTSVRRFMHPQGIVVQLVGFANADEQLPRYLSSMNAAGFDVVKGERLERRVPNRKWYAKLRGDGDASTELVLFHRPRA